MQKSTTLIILMTSYKREKNQALRDLLPHLFNSNIDNTTYHLIKNNNDGSFSKIRLNNVFFINQEPNKQES